MEGEAMTLPATAAVEGAPHDPDAELMLRFQRGERRCFDELFQKYRRPVINFAYRFTGRKDVAEELAQEIFVKCFRGAAGYRPGARFATWLFRIARNHCLNEVRRAEYRTRSQPLDPAAEPPSAGATPEAHLRGKDLERMIDAALQALPEKQRSALILCRFHQMSYDEIAATMQTSVSSVKSLLNRARQKLVAALAPALQGQNEDNGHEGHQV
jgi:RNA polymerase sigma-70 factor (ECF subfamily)